MVASQPGLLTSPSMPDQMELWTRQELHSRHIFGSFISQLGIGVKDRSAVSLSDVELQLRPAIGKPAPQGKVSTGSYGVA